MSNRSLGAESPARAASAAAPASIGRVRRGSLVILALILVEFGIGMYINLYVTVPLADRGHDLGSAHLGAITASVAGLIALALADAAGASFTSNGHPADSMAMSVLTGAALACYVATIYVVRWPPRQLAHPRGMG